jgi:branched-chain amino acid transport system permease protein
VKFWIFTEPFIVTLLAYLVVSLSLNLEAGFTGIPNFGKHVFVYAGVFAAQGLGVRIAAWMLERAEPQMVQEQLKHINEALGAHYTSLVQASADPYSNRFVIAIFRDYLPAHPGFEITLLTIIIVLAIVMGVLFGLVASYAALRLKEDYLAILLLSFAELMVLVIFYQVPWLSGGNRGLWAVTFTSNPTRFAVWASIALAILVYIYAEKLANSPIGRAMRAVRDDDLAASVFGRDVARIRLKVILVSSAMAALAGFVYIQSAPSTTSLTFNRVQWTFLPWAIIILGGMGNNLGVVLGTLVFVIGMRLFNYYQAQIAGALGLGGGSIAAATLANILIGVLILLVLFARPEGILPEKPSKTANFRRILQEEGE